MVTFLTLYTNDICDLWLKPCGLQYIILCLIVPIIAILLWIWKTDLFKKCKKYVVSTVVTAVLFIPLIMYFLFKPTIFNFSNQDTLNDKISSVEQTCLRYEVKDGFLQDRDDIIRKCSGISFVVQADVWGKKITKKKFSRIVQERTKQEENYPNYAVKSCEKIATEELMHCLKDKKCSCISDMIALIIKKNPDLQFSDKQINLHLKDIRQEARTYCDKQDMMKWWLDSRVFCKDNNI